MIPIRDTIQSRSHPVVNTLIIAINILIFIMESAQGAEIDRIIFTYGLVPARYSVPEIAAYYTWGQQALAFLSFAFLHGDFWHLLGNMWSLYIFGDKVEDRLGSINYLAFYLLCGIASGTIQMLLNWSSDIPTIGASGAISGVLGAYLLLYPRSKILTLIPIIFIPYFVELPAILFICLWQALQFLGVALAPAHSGNVAWWAHVGGFAFGFIVVKIFLCVPETDLSKKFRDLTLKQRTPRLQIVHTEDAEDGVNLYGFISLTAKEARSGTQKIITIPKRHQQRLLRIAIPGDTHAGTVLRFKGLGKPGEGIKGDLRLKVKIEEERK